MANGWPSADFEPAVRRCFPGGSKSGAQPDPNAEKALIADSPSLPQKTIASPIHILIVEDNQADAALIRRALARAGITAELHELNDGEKALRFFEAADADPQAPCPTLVLLDINLPRHQGGEILRSLRASKRCRGALVLVVTSSDSQRDRDEMNRLGADGYFRKPSSYVDYMMLGPQVRQLLDTADHRSPPNP